MLDLTTVTQDITHWIETFVEVPHPALGGWAPCPYARKARFDQDFEVRLGLAPMHDMIAISRSGLNGKSVVVFVYDPEYHAYLNFSKDLNTANQEFLLPAGLLALEDHPAEIETVNHVVMNQGTYALALVQSVAELNEKAVALSKKNFYHGWNEEYLQDLFRHRQDPRI